MVWAVKAAPHRAAVAVAAAKREPEVKAAQHQAAAVAAAKREPEVKAAPHRAVAVAGKREQVVAEYVWMAKRNPVTRGLLERKIVEPVRRVRKHVLAVYGPPVWAK